MDSTTTESILSFADKLSDAYGDLMTCRKAYLMADADKQAADEEASLSFGLAQIQQVLTGKNEATREIEHRKLQPDVYNRREKARVVLLTLKIHYELAALEVERLRAQLRILELIYGPAQDGDR